MILSDEQALLSTCYARLADDAPWLVYADWLRDRGEWRRAERVPVLRRVLVGLLPVALPIAERLPE